MSSRGLYALSDLHRVGPIGFNIERDLPLRAYTGYMTKWTFIAIGCNIIFFSGCWILPNSLLMGLFGMTCFCLWKMYKYKPVRWINGVTVLDNPFAHQHHKIDFEELGKQLAERQSTSTSWIRKEELLREHGYNVEMIDCAWTMIITHTIDSFLRTNQPTKIVVQTHRGGQGVLQNYYIKYHLEMYYSDSDQYIPKYSVPYNLVDGKPTKLPNPRNFEVGDVTVIFDNGYWPDTMKRRDDIAAHISVSLCGGLDPNIGSGTFIIPQHFSTLDVESEPHQYYSDVMNYSGSSNWLACTANYASVFNSTERFNRASAVCRYEASIEDIQHNTVRGTIAGITKIYVPEEGQQVNVVE